MLSLPSKGTEGMGREEPCRAGLTTPNACSVPFITERDSETADTRKIRADPTFAK
jgi:hypothetical protein